MSIIDRPTVYLCDRCSTEFIRGEGVSSHSYGKCTFERSFLGRDVFWGKLEKTIDLCGDCTEALNEFLNSESGGKLI